jgi:hypothetical protein
MKDERDTDGLRTIVDSHQVVGHPGEPKLIRRDSTA